MDNITLSLEVLGGILGKSPAELSTALKVEGSDELKPVAQINSYITTSFADKVKTIKDAAKTEGQGFGTRTAKQEAENYIKEAFGIEEGSLEERLKKIKAKVEANVKTGPKQLTPEAVRSSEVYKTDLANVKTALATEKQNHVATKSGYRTRELKRAVSSFATSLLSNPDNKFILPETKELKERWQSVFIDSLMKDGDVELKLNDDHALEIQGKDGAPLEDANYNPIGLDVWGMNVAKSLFPVAAAANRSTPTTTPATTTTTAPATANVPVFKSQAEYSQWLDKSMNDPKVTTDMLDAAKKQLATFEE